MRSRTTLNRMDIYGLSAATITTFLFLGGALDAGHLYASVRQMSVWDVALGLSGWFLATFGPLILALAFWRAAKSWRMSWLLHVLLLPLAWALLKVGSSMMLLVTGTPDFDDTIGGPIVQALALFLFVVLGYYSAVLYLVLKRYAL